MAGSKKHKQTWILKYYPNYFGKKGFRRPNQSKAEVISLRGLSQLAEKLKQAGEATYTEDRLLVDLTKLGYTRLIGSGRVDSKLFVVSEAWTKGSEQKIAEAGGTIVRPSQLQERSSRGEA